MRKTYVQIFLIVLLLTSLVLVACGRKAPPRYPASFPHPELLA